jgi:hypothetical protein
MLRFVRQSKKKIGVVQVLIAVGLLHKQHFAAFHADD